MISLELIVMETMEITREATYAIGLFACVFFVQKKTFAKNLTKIFEGSKFLQRSKEEVSKGPKEVTLARSNEKSLGGGIISWNIKKGVGSE